MRIPPAWSIVADVSSRSPRVGFLAVLVALAAGAAGYLNNCFAGLGLPLGGPGAGASKQEAANLTKKAEEAAAGPARVVVQGEQCLLAGEATPRACDVVCAEVPAGVASVDATVGSQRAVDALKACLQARGVKPQVVSE